jgi:hypothetical protein
MSTASCAVAGVLLPAYAFAVSLDSGAHDSISLCRSAFTIGSRCRTIAMNWPARACVYGAIWRRGRGDLAAHSVHGHGVRRKVRQSWRKTGDQLSDCGGRDWLPHHV